MALIRQMAPPPMGRHTLEAVRHQLPSSLWIGLPTDGLTPPLRPETDEAEADVLSRGMDRRETLASTWLDERALAIGLSARRAIDEAKKLQRQRLDGLRDDAGNNVARMYAEMKDAHAQVRRQEKARVVYQMRANGGVDITADVGAVVVVSPPVQGDLEPGSAIVLVHEQMKTALAELDKLGERVW
jgi:hypothetical protein